MPTSAAFRDLLTDEPLARFTRLSGLLLEDDATQPWLARAYYCTLLTGALAPSDLPDEATALPYRTAVRAFLAVTGLPSPGTARAVDIAAQHLAPVGNVSPFGHNAPFPYEAPYTLADVRVVLDRVPKIAALAGKARADALHALLLDPPGPAAAARGILMLWHASALLGKVMGYFIKTAPIETYASARVWPSIGGNPMGVPGPYYGSWAYPGRLPVVDGGSS